MGTSSLEDDLATALGLLRGPLGGAVRGFAVAAAGLVVAVDLAATGNLRTAFAFITGLLRSGVGLFAAPPSQYADLQPKIRRAPKGTFL